MTQKTIKAIHIGDVMDVNGKTYKFQVTPEQIKKFGLDYDDTDETSMFDAACLFIESRYNLLAELAKTISVEYVWLKALGDFLKCFFVLGENIMMYPVSRGDGLRRVYGTINQQLMY